jgi:hypothetical protein
LAEAAGGGHEQTAGSARVVSESGLRPKHPSHPSPAQVDRGPDGGPDGGTPRGVRAPHRSCECGCGCSADEWWASADAGCQSGRTRGRAAAGGGAAGLVATVWRAVAARQCRSASAGRCHSGSHGGRRPVTEDVPRGGRCSSLQRVCCGGCGGIGSAAATSDRDSDRSCSASFGCCLDRAGPVLLEAGGGGEGRRSGHLADGWQGGDERPAAGGRRAEGAACGEGGAELGAEPTAVNEGQGDERPAAEEEAWRTSVLECCRRLFGYHARVSLARAC